MSVISYALKGNLKRFNDNLKKISDERRAGYDSPQVLAKRGRKDMMRHCLDIINENEGTNYKI